MSDMIAAKPRRWPWVLVGIGLFLLGFGAGMLFVAGGMAHTFNVACPAPFRPEPGDHINIAKGPDVLPPKPLSRPLAFPSAANLAHVQGAVMTLIYIDAGGHVEQAHVLRSSGFCPFDVEAMKDLPNWRYAPAMQNGTPIGTWWIVNVIFRRGGQAAPAPEPAPPPARSA